MNKNSKSKIPVLVTKQKSSNLCNDEKNFQTRSCLFKKQSFATTHLIQNKNEKKLCSQIEKAKNFKDNNMINIDFKNKVSLKTYVKHDSISTNNKKSGNITSYDKNKLKTCKGTMKPNPTNKEITRTSDVQINAKNTTLSSFETKIKSGIDKNSVEDEKENLPSPKSYNFEAGSCTPKENQIVSKEDNFFAQENVEFEANEIYRKMILNNRQLTPSMCKLMPSLRLSALQSQRPSVYKKFEIPDDPLKEALRALENRRLSVQRVKEENKLPQSPYKNRDSIYTPCGDPTKAYLKRLEEFKLKRSQKTVSRSTKKVTFNLHIQECTPKNVCDIQQNPLKSSEKRLIQINEKSEENTPNSPECRKIDEINVSDIASKHGHVSNETVKVDYKDNEVKVGYKDGETKVYNKNCAYSECEETEAAQQGDITSDSNQKTMTIITADKLLHQHREVSLQKLKGISCWNSSPDFIGDNKKFPYGACTISQEGNNLQVSKQTNAKKSSKIYTPKPISLSLNSKMSQNYSPEFLVNGKSTLSFDLAPICTPLVLKGQAKKQIFSPEADEGLIPLKLDFAEEEKDTPKKETCKNRTLAALDNIVTTQKKLDYLADRECYHSLLNENFPVISGRYLSNPVATILNEGDDMHFIPVGLIL